MHILYIGHTYAFPVGTVDVLSCLKHKYYSEVKLMYIVTHSFLNILVLCSILAVGWKMIIAIKTTLQYQTLP